jgi:hypothetical protein
MKLTVIVESRFKQRIINEDFVDKICGHIDNWEEWSNPSKA